MITNDDVIETIDLEIEALLEQRKKLQSKYDAVVKETEEVKARLDVLQKLIEKMRNGK